MSALLHWFLPPTLWSASAKGVAIRLEFSIIEYMYRRDFVAKFAVGILGASLPMGVSSVLHKHFIPAADLNNMIVVTIELPRVMTLEQFRNESHQWFNDREVYRAIVADYVARGELLSHVAEIVDGVTFKLSITFIDPATRAAFIREVDSAAVISNERRKFLGYKTLRNGKRVA